MPEVIVETKAISKAFPGVRSLTRSISYPLAKCGRQRTRRQVDSQDHRRVYTPDEGELRLMAAT
jgi:hypothetical protein